MPKNKNVELLYEVGCLRFIPRTWVQFYGPNFANLAEHHFRVAWIAMLLAKMEDKGDLGKIVQMALVHDLAESRTGDVHYISRQYTKRDAGKAIADILDGSLLGPDLAQLWKEYEQHQSIEAKLVKDADWLDVDLEIREQKLTGRARQMEAWGENRKTIAKLLYTKAGKKLWRMIQKSNPLDWYLRSRNRYTDGDLNTMVKLQQRRKI